MINSSNLSVSGLIAHTHIDPETQRELQLAVSRVLVNAPTGMTIAHKQLALIMVLEELIKAHPVDHQTQNSLAVITTILLGSRLLTAMSATVRSDTVQ